MKREPGTLVAVTGNGICTVVSRQPFRGQSAVLRVRRSDGCEFDVDEACCQEPALFNPESRSALK